MPHAHPERPPSRGTQGLRTASGNLRFSSRSGQLPVFKVCIDSLLIEILNFGALACAENRNGCS